MLNVAEVMKVIGNDNVFFEMKDAITYWENYIAMLASGTGASSEPSHTQDAHPLLDDDGVSKEKSSTQNNPVDDKITLDVQDQQTDHDEKTE